MSGQPGNIYYVSPYGSDDGDGKALDSPFRTIRRAAEIMRAGDVCRIRGGVYRETVVPVASGTADAPIRFEAYPEERVVVSGCDPIRRWTHHEGAIYKGEMDWSVNDGNGNILFVDGELCHEAMWPPIGDRLDLSRYAVVDAAASEGSVASIFDEELCAFPDGYWNGAMVACVNGVGYFMSTALVADFRAGTLYFDQWVSSAPFYHTKPGNRYFITRTLKALVREKQWHYDREERMLYLRLPDGCLPEQFETEAKRREYAFDLRGRSHIQVVGIGIRGASVTTEDAEHCLIARAHIHGIDRDFGARQSIYGWTKGIRLGGRHNVIRESEICGFEGIGIHVSGYRNRVINCHIHDGNFEATYASLVWITGAEHLVSDCTITRAGRTCVSGVFARSVIQHCDISHANCLTHDSGIVYLFNSDFDGTEIHHNWLHDNRSSELCSFGFYMDAWTSGVSFYRNAVWNIPHRGLHINCPNQRTLIYNNTFYRSGDAQIDVHSLDEMYGTHMINNIFANGSLARGGGDALLSHNFAGADAGLADPDNGDFRLRPDSPAIGRGRRIAGITDGFRGTAPDPGAYECGGDDWTPGHDFGGRPERELVFADLECRSKLFNGGFETGEWAPWIVARGAPQVVFGCAWDYSGNGHTSVVRSNKYAAMLGSGDRIEQTVRGLKPQTVYIFWAGVKSEGYCRNAERYDDCHAGERWHRSADGRHAVYRDVAYVGPLQPGDWLKYGGVDFGQAGKYDQFAVGLTKIVAPFALELRLDSPTGELLGVVRQERDYDGVWRYFSIPIGPAEGVHDVYLVISDQGRCLLDNFKLYDAFITSHTSSVRMAVHGRGGSLAAATLCKMSWEAKTDKLVFTTGPDDTEVVVSIENTGVHYACIDDCGLWKPDLPEE